MGKDVILSRKLAHKLQSEMQQRDAYEKTLQFNQYVKDLVDSKQPELLIIGIPNPIMKYNHKLLYGLGILPHIICSGVQSDLNILCLQHGMYKKLFFDELSQHCKYRLGGSADFFNIANVSSMPDLSSSDSGKPEINYLNLKSDFVLQSIKDMNIDSHYLFNALNNNSSKNACEAIQNALTDNVHLMI